MYLNKTKIALLVFTSLGFTNVFSQENNKKIKVSEFTLMPSIYLESNPSASINDFYILAPNSKLLPTSYDGYNISNYSSNSGGFSASALLGFKFLNKEGNTYRANPLFRAGITYTYAQNISSYANYEETTPYDTLTSNNTGNVYYIDSVTVSQLDMQYETHQVKLDVSLLFRTNPEARWSLFAGIGAQVGTSINAQTQINKYEGNYFISDLSSELSYYVQGNDSEYEIEEFMNENAFTASVYLPMGVDFRVSNKNEFFQRIHLFYEMRPALNMTSIPELRMLTNGAFGYGFGMKVNWN